MIATSFQIPSKLELHDASNRIRWLTPTTSLRDKYKAQIEIEEIATFMHNFRIVLSTLAGQKLEMVGVIVSSGGGECTVQGEVREISNQNWGFAAVMCFVCIVIALIEVRLLAFTFPILVLAIGLNLIASDPSTRKYIEKLIALLEATLNE